MKSPGGSIFPYYYKGGEIHCLKYGSKYKNEEALFVLMKQEEEFIVNTNKKLKIWVDFYMTSITSRVLEKLINNLNNFENYTERLAFVGLSTINQWRLKKHIAKAGINIQISYFSDPEDAKTWLVCER